jgi:hypothetical protein
MTTLNINRNQTDVEAFGTPEHPNQAFLNYIKEAEGWHGRGSDSPEGGSQTAGWGHKLRPGEDFSDATDEELEELFMKDYDKAVTQAQASINNKYNKLLGTTDAWSDLSVDRQNMVLDFVYNTGQVPHMLEKGYSGRFTQFGDAIMSGDSSALMAKGDDGEWIGQRYFTDKDGNKQSLGRNKLYRNFFGLNK